MTPALDDGNEGWALAYADLGWPVLPIKAGSKVPLGHLVPHGWADATTDPAVVRRWWTIDPGAGIGVALAPAGLMAIDVDPRNGGDLSALPIDASGTLTARTGGGGQHVIYRVPEGYEPIPCPWTGVDFKHRGYIIVEPTRHPDGPAYEWLDWEVGTGAPEVAVAPLALLQRVGELAEVASFGAEPIGEAALADLRATLATIPSDDRETWIGVGHACASIRNDGVGFQLWDEWSQRSPKYDARDARRVWASFGQTRSHWKWILKHAEELGGQNVMVSAPRATRYVVETPAELMARPIPRWLVAGVLPERGLAVIYGRSGCGKSFAVLDLLASIARGKRWHGRRVRQGVVVYVGLEGTTKKRLWAYMQHHGLDGIDGLLVVDGQSVNLLGADTDADALVEAIRAKSPGPVAVVVFDTLNRTMPGGNENASEDMGAVVSRASRIEQALGCVVGFVHHSGKSASAGARGHSSLRAACDLEMEVTEEAGIRTITATKVKDGEEDQAWHFRLEPVDLGPSPDPEADPDERIGSLVVVPVTEPPPEPHPVMRLGPAEETAWQAFCDAATQAGLTHGQRAEYGVPDTAAACTVEAWRGAFEGLRPLTAPMGEERKRELAGRRQTWRRGYTGLIEKGWLRVSERLGIVVSMLQRDSDR